jgi:ATP-dependent Lhr-like helicase
MALRKRFCTSFNRELQAAATDDGICISLVEQHSFPLSDVFLMLRAHGIERDLIQASLASPMFTNRWRWNANRALALLRHSGGKKVPVALQRMRAEDLLAAVFPEQLMCQDNQIGPLEPPDHPLVNETMRDCLHEAMDSEGLKDIVARIERGEIETVCVDTLAPSPMAHQILNANPYAFLDDAPLEERRARAVSLRGVDPLLDRELGRLDPAAIDEVRDQARPDVRSADELHDFLLGVALLPLDQAQDWEEFAQALIRSGRATAAHWTIEGRAGEAYVAAERWSWIQAILPQAEPRPVLTLSPALADGAPDAAEVFRRVVHAWLEVLGPTTVAQLASMLALPEAKIDAAMLVLESSGVVLRGQFTSGGSQTEWCERGLLARIHRLTLGRMRKEIEPVSATEFMKFLVGWQHASPAGRLRGREGILQVIRQLQGLELPAPAWEQHVLPARIVNYDPADLEQLCLAGVVAWGRLRSELPALDEPESDFNKRRRRRARRPTRSAPIAFLVREERDYFLDPNAETLPALSPAARDVATYLARHGASFLSDIARGTALLKVKAEESLWELVARGVATGDGIAGLRVLLTPEKKRQKRRRRLKLISGGHASERMMPVGRWSLWRTGEGGDGLEADKIAEHQARQLLRRYGVVFRELLARENCAAPWRVLQQFYRRLEARGEIRGGRFITGFVGEQFALPEAVDRLRAERRSQHKQEPLIIAAADPLNLVGVLSAGARVSPYSQQAIAYDNGAALEVGTLGSLRSKLQSVTP